MLALSAGRSGTGGAEELHFHDLRHAPPRSLPPVDGPPAQVPAAYGASVTAWIPAGMAIGLATVLVRRSIGMTAELAAT